MSSDSSVVMYGCAGLPPTVAYGVSPVGEPWTPSPGPLPTPEEMRQIALDAAPPCEACRWYAVFMSAVAGALPRGEYDRLVGITKEVTGRPPPHGREPADQEQG